MLRSLQWLACGSAFEGSGVLSWERLRTARRHERSLTRHLGRLMGAPGFLWVLRLEALAALVLILAGPSLMKTVALGVIVGAQLLFHLRSFPYGVSGDDRMRLAVAGALLLRELAPSSALALEACLWFIALQACLSYVTAGAVKLGRASWRTGATIPRVLELPLFRSGGAAGWLRRHAGFGNVLNWGLALFQISFPLVLLVGFPVGWAFLFVGLAFHGSVAVFMGLNGFLWAWGATYPAIFYVAVNVHGGLAR